MVYCYQVDSDDGRAHVEAIDENGRVLAQASALDLDNANDECMTALAKQGVRTQWVKWINDPTHDPDVQRALARANAAQPTSPLSPLTQHRLQRAQEHQCSSCSHEMVCIVADATRRVASLQAIVTGCLGWDPPPATTQEELADQLARVAHEQGQG